MSRTTLETLQKAIDEKYRLTRDGRDWKLADGVKLRVPNRHSLGFSLDNRKNPPFAFFSGNPPTHVAKMCDAIVILPYQVNLYFFVVEQKTGNKDDYARQLANGKFFCEWLVALWCHHGYCDAASVRYVGMLVWQPRQSPRKGRTAHRKPKPGKSPLFDLYFEEPNNPLIMLTSYLE